MRKSKAHDLHASCEVWKNLVIISAHNEFDAYQKATAIGKRDDGDCRGTLQLDGKPAVTCFLGVADMGLIYDDLKDGAEILWQIHRCRQSTALRLVADRATLVAELKVALAKRKGASQ